MARGFALPHPQLPKEANSIAAIMANFRAISDYLNKAGQVMFGNLDMNGFDITDFGQLTGGDAWTSYSPSLTNITQGNGTVIAKYIQIGKLVTVRFHFTLGTTSAVGTTPTIGLPVTAASDYTTDDLLGVAKLVETGVVSFWGGLRFNTTTTVSVDVGTASGAHVQWQGVTALIPFTWGDTDDITFTINYEAA